jgi:heat shock protein HslJ
MERSLWTVLASGVAAGAMLMAAACAADQSAGEMTGGWRLHSLVVSGEDIPLLEDHPVTMTVSDGKLSGVAGCNQYEVEFFHRRGDIAVIGGPEQTLMLCAAPVIEVERAFLGSLPQVERIAANGDELELTGPAVRLRFEPEPPS